jgi:hypothetical protein
MPRPKIPNPRAAPSVIRTDDPEFWGAINTSELARFNPTIEAWERIVRNLTRDARPAVSFRDLLARNKLIWMVGDKELPATVEIVRCLQDYAYAVSTLSKGPTPRAMATKSARLIKAIDGLMSQVSTSDWWTGEILTNAGIGFIEMTSLADARRHLQSVTDKLRQSKVGQREDMPRRDLASGLAVAFCRLRPHGNDDWRSFVSLVLTQVGISHPSPIKERIRFDALLHPAALECLRKPYGEVSGVRRTRSLRPGALPSPTDLGAQLLAAALPARLEAPKPGRPRRKKGT